MKLRLIGLEPQTAAATFLLDDAKAEHIKVRALERLGIVPQDGESPYRAWLRVMCEENGIEFTIPVARELSQAILDTPNALRFSYGASKVRNGSF